MSERGDPVRALYAAYCRSCTRAACSPAVVFLGLAIVIIAVAGRAVMAHAHAIAHAAVIAAAVSLTLLAGALLRKAAVATAAATGRHTDILPVPLGVRADGRTVPVPVPVPGSYTWRIRPPARVPGKSDVVTPAAADMAAMAADADALEGGLDVLVTPDGRLATAEPEAGS